MAAVRGGWLAAAVLVCSGCGPGLVDGRYEGEPRLALKGSTSPPPPEFEPFKRQLRLSLFYAAKGIMGPQTLDGLVEHEATGQSIELPWSLDWTIYDEPEARHLMTPDFALGIPVVYADKNGNHHRDADEPMVGQAGGTGVVFVKRALSAQESPTRRPAPAVFALVAKPLPCSPPPAIAPGETDCGVPLAEPCMSDAACGTGKCLTAEPWPWPGGYCSLQVTPGGCAPKTGIVWRSHAGTQASYWVQRCETTAECRDPYVCDPLQKACLPLNNVSLRISPETRVLPLCQPGPGMTLPPP